MITNKASVSPPIILGPPESNTTQSARQATQTGFPVEIPSYAVLSDKIAGGHQPFPDGITWLKEAGFSTVVHLRSSTEEESATRQLIERQGLAYKPIVVTPQTMDQNFLATLGREIQSAQGRPLFIFDRDGSRTGAAWIAYASRELAIPEIQAREQASRLGYRKETADQAWENAIANLLKSR